MKCLPQNHTMSYDKISKKLNCECLACGAFNLPLCKHLKEAIRQVKLIPEEFRDELNDS